MFHLSECRSESAHWLSGRVELRLPRAGNKCRNPNISGGARSETRCVRVGVRSSVTFTAPLKRRCLAHRCSFPLLHSGPAQPGPTRPDAFILALADYLKISFIRQEWQAGTHDSLGDGDRALPVCLSGRRVGKRKVESAWAAYVPAWLLHFITVGAESKQGLLKKKTIFIINK